MTRFSLSILFTCVTAAMAVGPIPGVKNHWVANTGGNQFDHIQNFIEDMVVKPDGTVLTQSSYDEGLHPNGAYKDGRSSGFNFETDTANPHPSRRATFGGVTWTIRNFWGKAFMAKVHPPVQDSMPFIESSDGRFIRSIADPTALAFDRSGKLYVGDNGPDQNIKIFDVAGTPKIVGSFGDSGGVFAGPVRGATGPKRFWGIRGIGFDSLGRIYVGCTGMPMQVGGGTHIRSFSGLSAADTLIWEVICLAFVNTVDADPDSGGTSLQKNHTRFHMDWTKPPGRSWKFAAVTSDPFKYPDDPRFTHSLESVWFRRVQGKRFLFLNDMYGNFLAINRFEDNSEIGVPTIFLPIGSALRDSTSWDDWAVKLRPNWPAKEGDERRWIWRDDNADGQVQANEFHTYELLFPYTRVIDIDDVGDIWWSGGSYMVQFPTGGLDPNGVPRYPTDSIRKWKVPFFVRPENNNYVMHLRYLTEVDAMIIGTGYKDGVLSNLYRYDNWSKTAQPFLGWGATANSADTLAHTWKITVPHKFPETWVLDPRVIDTCIFPNNMTADKDFIYVAYVDKGPYAKRNGEVTVFDSRTGETVGWIAPGPETSYLSGWFDLWHAVNSYTMPDGQKLLMTEEDYAGKVNVYKWCPSGVCRTTQIPTPTVGSPVLRQIGRSLYLESPEVSTWKLTLRNLSGELLWNTSGTGPTEWSRPPVRGLVIGTVYSSKGSTSTSLYIP